MSLRLTAEMAPLIHATANRMQVLDTGAVLATVCAGAEVLRGRGIKTAFLVKVMIDQAVADELEVVPRPRGQG